jgi:hypothetical protein
MRQWCKLPGRASQVPMRNVVRMSRVLLLAVESLVMIAALFVLSAPDASAQPTTDMPSASTYVTNGDVQAIAVDRSGRVYLGGSFSEVGPRIGHGVSLTSSNDQPAAGWPDVNGEIDAVVSDGAGGWFVGGQFTYVGGLQRAGLAHIESDGAVDPSWRADVGGGSFVTVDALALSGDSLFVGGWFSSVGGQARSGLAEVSASGDGAVDESWDPSPDGGVYALALAGGSLFVGGAFASVGGESIANLAEVSTSGSGSVNATWDPAPSAWVQALLLSGSELFVGGAFTTIGGQSRTALAELSTTGTGVADPTWNPSPGRFDNEPVIVGALALSGDDLFVGGSFSGMGGQALNRIAEVSTSGAGEAVSSWDPAGSDLPTINALAVVGGELYVAGSFSELGGAGQSDLVRLSVSSGVADTSWDPNVNGIADAIGVSGTDLYVGGDFTSAGTGNVPRSSLARLNPNGTLDTSWNPQPSGPVSALALVGDSLYVGGGFEYVDGVPREGIAELSTTAVGALDQAWNPALGLDARVSALAVSGQEIYIGAGIVGPVLVRASLAGDGDVDQSWDPALNGFVSVLAVAGSELYVGGNFTSIGGQERNGIARLSTTGSGLADPVWDPTLPFESYVGAIALTGDTAYLGGQFNEIGDLASDGFAAVPLEGTGSANPIWQPTFRLNGESGGGIGPDALAVDQSDLYIGGLFTTVDGVARNNFAALELNGAAVDPSWNPDGNEGAGTFATSGNGLVAAGGFTAVGPLSTEGVAVFGDISLPSVTLTTPANGDTYKQGQHVTASYSCSDPGAVVALASCGGPVATGHGVDTSKPGHYSFTVTATDADGNTSTQTATYTVLATPPPQPSNRFTILRPFKTERGSKTILIRIDVPGKGSLHVTECAGLHGRADRCRAERDPTIAGHRFSMKHAGTFTLRITLTRTGRKAARRHHRISGVLRISYTPSGGHEATKTVNVTFAVAKQRRHDHHHKLRGSSRPAANDVPRS